jgi:hypothetical protein
MVIGSRDPYVVTGHGAGFVMCFRSNVSWDIHQDDDPKKFMTVKCGEYVMAIPDYSNQARQISHESGHDTESIFSTRGHQDDAMFKKVVMKLSGRVRWLVGLVFERDLQEGGRSFQFIPHYQVKLRTPDYTKSSTHQVSLQWFSAVGANATRLTMLSGVFAANIFTYQSP